MKEQRWQDWTNLLLGTWLVLTPFFGIGGFSDIAAFNSYLIGAAVAAFAIAALARPLLWEEYINLSLGVWLIAAPFILGFAAQAGPTLNQVIVGLLIGSIALGATLQKGTVEGGHGHGHGHA
jgi:SPW repeat